MNEIMLMNADGAAEAERITQLLKGNGIEAYYQSDYPDDIIALIKTDDRDLVGVYVPREDYFKAKEILKNAPASRADKSAKKAQTAVRREKPKKEKASADRKTLVFGKIPLGLVPPLLFAVIAVILIGLYLANAISAPIFWVVFVVAALIAVAAAFLLDKRVKKKK